jgi:hypothetical protein
MCSGEAGLSLGQCGSDGDCTAGLNGRCSFPDGPPPTCMRFCSYDECPSVWTARPRSRASAGTHLTARMRISASRAATARSTPTADPWVTARLEDLCDHPMYFCHTPQDTCTDDSDCTPLNSGIDQTCNYDSQIGHFACGPGCALPP